jgi:cytoskeleton protein RodZ
VPDIGNILREARIRRGLSVTDVEDVTKIRGKYIEALEENDFEVLPGPTVVKGFLRSYAIFLKLDPDLVLHEYRSLYESRREDIGAPLRTDLTQQRRTQTSAERKKKRTRRTQRGYVAAALFAILVIIFIAWLGARNSGKGAATLDAGNLPSTTSTVTTALLAAQSTTSSTAAATSTSSTETVPTTTGDNVTMVLGVTQESCWFVVRENSEGGAELYAGALSAGGKQTFNTAQSYWVRAGVPEVLSVSVNGTPYTITGGAGTFLVSEAGVERLSTDSTGTTK